MRFLEVWDGGAAAPIERYRVDQAMIMRAALCPETAFLRVFRSSQPGVALGRFHRRDAEAPAALTRRSSGGRSTPTGPEFLEIALAVSRVGWLDPGSSGLRPEQVLNRALRPLLAALRSLGIDAFYPGRDLVTVDQAPLAACSYTVLPDRVALIEMCIGVDGSLALLAERVRDLDRAGVAAIEPGGFDGAVSLRDLLASVPAQESWVTRLAESAEADWACTANALPTAPAWCAMFTPADEAAFAAFLNERIAQPQDTRTAAAITMLGVVEASARVVDDQVTGLEICGDVIAPAATLSALTDACEGAVAAAPALRRAVTTVLSEEKHFLLGLEGVDDLLCRLL